MRWLDLGLESNPKHLLQPDRTLGGWATFFQNKRAYPDGNGSCL